MPHHNLLVPLPILSCLQRLEDLSAAKLRHILEPVRPDRPSTGDLGEACRRFSRASGTCLRGLGPAFFTKLLYFADTVAASAASGR